jgi:ubiquinone/menaquinone biosynthesis C-methylase UbiE
VSSKYDMKQSLKYSKEPLLDSLTLRPVVRNLMCGIKGKKVLDLGCGSGRYSIAMAKMGARVMAIDKSPIQVGLARKLNSHPAISYFVCDGVRIRMAESKSMDMVLMNMVLSDLSGRREFMGVLKEIRRVLKPGRRLLISTLHPLSIIPDSSPNRAVNFNRRMYFRDGYSYKSVARLIGGGEINFSDTHFSLSSVSESLRTIGFIIEQIFESRQSKKFGTYLPKFIILVAKKI